MGVPSIWKGQDEYENSVIIKYRHGAVMVFINSKLKFIKRIGGDYDGHLEYDELVKVLNKNFILPEKEIKNW